jgi:glycosyltransferase involved in cell wall biosynthesis
MPTISVILTTFNRAQLVGEAIDSVLCQTFTDFELIVVDDGSTDRTEEAVRSFADPRIKYIWQANKGLPAARNTGIEAAAGDYIAFLDDDDLFLPEKLSLQIAKVAENSVVGLVYGLYLSNTGPEDALKTAGACYPQLELRRLLLGPAFHWSTVLMRRTLLEKVGLFDETFLRGQDWELTLRLALVGCQMICVSQPVTLVRRQPVSNTRDQLQHVSTLLAVLEKTFGDPRMPVELMSLRDQARSSQLLRTAASAFVTSHFDVGQELVQRALATCPSLMSGKMDFLVDTLIYRIRGLSLVDPADVLQQVIHYLPGDRAFLRKLKPKLWSRFYEIAAFQAYQSGQRGKCVAAVIRAVYYTPSLIRNRGLFSIFARSLVSNQTRNEFSIPLTIQQES